MPLLNATQVTILGCTIVWDSITRPDTNDGGNTRWGVKVVLPPGHPDVAVVNQLAQQELQTSEFRGVLPNGGLMPVGVAGPGEFNGLFPGWSVLNCTTFRMPEVYNEAGALMDPMQYGQLLYAGQKVDVLVHCRAYNNKSKGVATRLDGLRIVTSANAPRIDVGGGSSGAAAAFGAPSAGQPAPAAVYAGQAPVQNHAAVPGMAPPPPAPPAGMAPVPPPAPPAVKSNGFTVAQLLAAGWTQAQIDAIP